ncbi:hypothetical protein FACS18949_13580 [Clostridia bacterium]|nr:hypothetical protein FACS189425_06250 [Clostridia bacterium]GHV35487.1 hypothetical protein FACS18949_13580 [Clostridia bacterium]
MSADNITAIALAEVGNKPVIIKMSKPFSWEDKPIEDIRLDLDSLTGDDILSIENELAAQGKYIPILEISTEFIVEFAARASGIDSAALLTLHAKDFTVVRNAVRNFLLGTD